MHIHGRHLFGVLVACAVGVVGVATTAAQSPASGSAQAGTTTLTGCVEYGPGESYILATMSVPAQPDLSNEPALEREELAAAEHSYRLTPTAGEHLSQLIGAKVRAAGTLSHVAASPANGRGSVGRGPAAPTPAVDQLNASSVQKLADHCDARLTMFVL